MVLPAVFPTCTKHTLLLSGTGGPSLGNNHFVAHPGKKKSGHRSSYGDLRGATVLTMSEKEDCPLCPRGGGKGKSSTSGGRKILRLRKRRIGLDGRRAGAGVGLVTVARGVQLQAATPDRAVAGRGSSAGVSAEAVAAAAFEAPLLTGVAAVEPLASLRPPPLFSPEWPLGGTTIAASSVALRCCCCCCCCCCASMRFPIMRWYQTIPVKLLACNSSTHAMAAADSEVFRRNDEFRILEGFLPVRYTHVLGEAAAQQTCRIRQSSVSGEFPGYR